MQGINTAVVCLSSKLAAQEEQEEILLLLDSQQRPMRTNLCSCPRLIYDSNDKIRQAPDKTNLSCCLGLIGRSESVSLSLNDNGHHKSTNSLLLLVP